MKDNRFIFFRRNFILISARDVQSGKLRYPSVAMTDQKITLLNFVKYHSAMALHLG